MSTLTAIAAALALSAVPAHAQYSADQRETLKGIRTLFVNIQIPAGVLPASDGQELWDAIGVQLRSAGLRLVETRAEAIALDSGAVLNLGFIAQPNMLSQDVSFRMDMEQVVDLPRIDGRVVIPTWYYEATERGTQLHLVAEKMMRAGVTRFLAEYLSANGR